MFKLLFSFASTFINLASKLVFWLQLKAAKKAGANEVIKDRLLEMTKGLSNAKKAALDIRVSPDGPYAKRVRNKYRRGSSK